MLIITAFHFNGFGQIKIDDGSYTPKVDGMIKEAQVLPEIPPYSSLFEDLIGPDVNPNYNHKPTAYLDLRLNDICSLKEAVNPVGESVYISSDNYPERLFLNTRNMTATVKSIPKGYYTIVGWFGKFDGCYYDERGDLRQDKKKLLQSIKVHYNLLNDYTFDNEYNKNWAHAMFFHDCEPRTIERWAEDYTDVLYDMNRYHDSIRKNKVLNDHLINDEAFNNPKENHGKYFNDNYIYKYSFFILEDNDGNRYYDFNGSYISITCYNKITELILNKEVVMETPKKDFLTEKELKSTSNESVYLCKDLFLRDNHLVGVFGNETGEFTTNITGYHCGYFDGLGLIGMVRRDGVLENHLVSGYRIYPHSYDELRKNAIQKEKKDEAEKKQRMEQEAERKRQERRNNLIAKYGEKWGNLISEHKVAVGMTKEMCKEAIGYPSNTFTKTTEIGKSEVWVYNNSLFTRWLYFYDGVLYMIETAD